MKDGYNIMLTVLGLPHGQMRARAARYGQHARVHKHPRQERAEQNFIGQIVPQLPPGFTPLIGPLQIDLYFYLTRPKNHYGTGKNAGKLKQSAPRHPTTKPDWDNTIKHVCDCLNKLVFDDDRQICKSSTLKAYANDNRPRTTIYIKELE